jgi:hypothetical protein
MDFGAVVNSPDRCGLVRLTNVARIPSSFHQATSPLSPRPALQWPSIALPPASDRSTAHRLQQPPNRESEAHSLHVGQIKPSRRRVLLQSANNLLFLASAARAIKPRSRIERRDLATQSAHEVSRSPITWRVLPAMRPNVSDAKWERVTAPQAPDRRAVRSALICGEKRACSISYAIRHFLQEPGPVYARVLHLGHYTESC